MAAAAQGSGASGHDERWRPGQTLQRPAERRVAAVGRDLAAVALERVGRAVHAGADFGGRRLRYRRGLRRHGRHGGPVDVGGRLTIRTGERRAEAGAEVLFVARAEGALDVVLLVGREARPAGVRERVPEARVEALKRVSQAVYGTTKADWSAVIADSDIFDADDKRFLDIDDYDDGDEFD